MRYKRDKWKWTAWQSDPKQQKNKDKEGVKVLHTKSQAGRTQKSGPPATRFECHLLRCTVKLRTACEKGKGKNRGEETTQLQDVSAWGWSGDTLDGMWKREIYKEVHLLYETDTKPPPLAEMKLFSFGTTLCCFLLIIPISWGGGGNWMSNFYEIVLEALNYL